MKTRELRDLNKDDLAQKLSVSYEELNKLNYQKRIGSLDKPHKFRIIRKDIARIKTILKELETKDKIQKNG
ncbi:MAG: 50S ribosomal protein L29 [Candidatus Omnitrophota bacterium]